MKAKFLGCLVGKVREPRTGLTIGTTYEIIDIALADVPRFVLFDDDGDLRHRPQSDFEVARVSASGKPPAVPHSQWSTKDWVRYTDCDGD